MMLAALSWFPATARRTGAYCLLFAGLGIVSGCLHYVEKPIQPERTAGQFEARTLADAGLRSFLEAHRPEIAKEWPRRTWGLDDLTLAAFFFHPSLDVARAEWEAAKAAIITAGGRPNPTLTIGPGYNFNAEGVTPWQPFGELEFGIETAGKRGYRVARAEHLSESARLAVAASAWRVRSRLRARLVDFAAAAERETLLRRQFAVQEQTVVAQEQRRKVGALSAAEVTPARLLLQKFRLEVSAEQALRAETEARLAESVGVPVSALSGVEIVFDLTRLPPAVDSLTSGEARRRALLGRSDLLESLAEYAAGQSALQLEIAKQYPDIRLGPGYEFDEGQNKWQLGLTIELPVFNRNRGPIAEAEARRTASAARFAQLQAGVIAEIDTALAAYRAAQTTLTEAASLLETQKKQMESVRQQFRAGAADSLDVLGAQLELAISELAVLDSRIKLQGAVGVLEDAVQRPFEWPAVVFESAPKREGS